VPTYGKPGNGLSDVIEIDILTKIKTLLSPDSKEFMHIENSISGKSWALSDFRTFNSASNKKSFLDLGKFSESEIGSPIEHFNIDSKKYSRSALNYLQGLAFLQKTDPLFEPKVTLEIGGGFGSLGEILAKTGPRDIKYIGVDLPPVIFIAEWYLSQIFGQENVDTLESTSAKQNIKISELKKFSNLCSFQIENLEGHIDLFVNYISFQEMEPDVVKNYLQKVAGLRPKYLLLRNMREGKNTVSKSQIGVMKPVTGTDYSKYLKAYRLIDSDVNTFGYKTVDGFHSEVSIYKRID
jgi:putative sugar O-methyltransferase